MDKTIALASPVNCKFVKLLNGISDISDSPISKTIFTGTILKHGQECTSPRVCYFCLLRGVESSLNKLILTIRRGEQNCGLKLTALSLSAFLLL